MKKVNIAHNFSSKHAKLNACEDKVSNLWLQQATPTSLHSNEKILLRQVLWLADYSAEVMKGSLVVAAEMLAVGKVDLFQRIWKTCCREYYSV